MNALRRTALCLLALAVLVGCAKTTVTSSQQMYPGQRAARPDRIIVHNFAASAADAPAWAATASQYAQPATPPTPEQEELGRKLGAQVAKELVTEIQAMGLPAVQAAGQPAPRPGDLVLFGYFESVNAGSEAKRIALGFGSGAAELRTRVEGYLMTEQGLRLVGSGDVDSAGGKGPGMAVPLAVAAATANPIGLIVSGAVKVGGEVSGYSTIDGAAKRTAKEIGDQLRVRFQRQGWI